MTTGQVLKIKGQVMAAQIIISKDVDPRICWTHYHNLVPILEEDA